MNLPTPDIEKIVSLTLLQNMVPAKEKQSLKARQGKKEK
jgi:hypothetical protein